MAVTQAQLTELYLAYFGRPPDFDGIQYYTSNPAFTTTSVAAGFSASAESQALYGTTFGAAQINAIYQNLFNRDAEPAGLTYWSQEVQAGRITPAGAALAILNGAQNLDKTAATNKIQIATAFVGQLDTNAEIIGYSGTAAAASARAFLRTVTDVATTVTAATSGLAGAVANAVGIGSTAPGANGGQTFALTTAVDTLTGTGGNDLFVATADSTAANNPTFTTSDTITGGNGTDTLNLTITGNAATVAAANVTGVEIVNARAVSGNAQIITASNFTGATQFNADRATDALTLNNLAAGQAVGMIGNGTVVTGALTANYVAGNTSATVNVSGGTATGSGAITLTNAGATVNVNSSTAANTVGAVALGGAATALNINANSNLTTGAITGFTGAAAKITVTGSGTSANIGTLETGTVKTVDASAFIGGVTLTANATTTLVVNGGQGNDVITTGAVLAATGLLDAGAGTGDRLVLGANGNHVDATTSKLIKNFEVVDVTTATVDLDLLAGTNTLTGLRVGGSATVNNINAATTGAVTVYANATPVLNVKGATTPGQLDTVKIDVNDGAAAVATITLTAPTLTAVETLQVTATDNVTITSLANALALTGISFTGAGAISMTTTAIALNPNVVVDASAATGNFTLDATGATANGYTIKGSAGTNVLTGGSAPIAVDITKSAAKADQVILTSAAGSTLNVLNTVSGFTNAVTTGDKLDVIGAATIQADVAAGTATGVTNLTGTVTGGILTFAGTAAATATLTDKINAAASANFAGNANEIIAFEHAGNTYVFSQQATDNAYTAGADLIVQLTGVTGVTALSTAASGATTIFVA